MWKTNLKVLVLALLVIGFYTTVAHVIPQLQSEVPSALDLSSGVTPEALVTAGEKLFDGAGGCTTCHGLGTRAPNLVTDFQGQGPIGARCGSRKQGMDCKAYLYESLTDPGAFVVPGFENIMPDMRRQLSLDQIWAVIAYLQSQGGEVTVTAEDIPKAPAGGAAPPPAAGSVVTTTLDPRVLIVEKGCSGCHILDGKGPPIGPPFDGVGRRLTAEYIRRSILLPNADTAKGYEKFAGMMPQTFGQQLSAAQLEALVQFLVSRK
ncbi:MAG TPA: c-type cytochrome [Gemmatimonadales bacterium]|jgi:mono/diheme cytochrome c family protein|nr:c-type cytochrome [Gemmatimonadales bacterium]